MNSQRLFSALILASLISLPACWKATEEASKKQGLYVLNVLDKQLYDDCHIKGSLNVPFNDLEKFVADLDPEKAEIVLYCSNYMCTSSEFCCKKLKAMGFKHVWAYEGGTAEWYQMGLPVEGTCTSSYLKQTIEKPSLDEHRDINVLTANELAEKMKKGRAA